jgi:hypothetical protein
MSPKTEKNRRRSSSETRYRSVLYLLESPRTLKQVEIVSIKHKLWGNFKEKSEEERKKNPNYK